MFYSIVQLVKVDDYSEEPHNNNKGDIINYAFKTPFELQKNPIAHKFVINSIISKKENFQIYYKTFPLSLIDYNSYDLISDNLVTLMDLNNSNKFKVFSIETISKSTYDDVSKIIGIELFSIEKKVRQPY